MEAASAPCTPYPAPARYYSGTTASAMEAASAALAASLAARKAAAAAAAARVEWMHERRSELEQLASLAEVEAWERAREVRA